MLTGLLFGSIFLVRLGDIFGRKRILVIIVTISSIVLMGIIFTQNLLVLYMFIFLFGMTAAPRGALSFVYALELTTKRHEAFYSMLTMVCDSSGLIVLGTYFYFVKDMKPVIYALVVIQSLLIVLVGVFMPESPKFLYEKGELERFRKAMQQIAKLNGKYIEIEEIRALETQC